MNELIPESDPENMQQLIHSAYRSEMLPDRQQKDTLMKMLATEHRRLRPMWLFPGLALALMGCIVILLAGWTVLTVGGVVVPDAADVRFNFCGLLVLMNFLCVPAASILILRSRKWKQN